MAKITVISGAMSGKTYTVEGLTTFGRGPSNTMVFSGLDSRSVSNEHAEMTLKGDSIIIKDKNSTNGTFVNGDRIDSQELNHNDIITFGVNGPKIRLLLEDTTRLISLNMNQPVEPKKAARKGVPNIPRTQYESIPLVPGHDNESYTMNLSKRLKTGEVVDKEMEGLLRNKDRISRMAVTGEVSPIDLMTLKSASQAFSKSKKKSYKIISGISVVSFLIIGVLFFQNYGYRQKLKQQKNLLDGITAMNEKLAASSEGSEIEDDEDRLTLLAKVRSQERQLMRLRGKIHSKDLKSLYKDPLGIEIHNAMLSFGEHDYIVPDIFIQSVKKYLKSWKYGGVSVRTAIKNKKIHGALILKELERANMPSAFLYLAMHESNLDSTIVSHAGARGIWQFMPATGREYKLEVPANWEEVDSYLDQRTDPKKSTKAAIRYLKTLVAELGSVPLAMASYNAGPGRIRRELRKIDDPINNRDFWYIYRSGTLAEETNEYVPKIVATMIVDLHPQDYGM